MEGWGEFYIAEVGAAAALAGLLVVAISINIEKIMAIPTLPSRAAQTLIIVGAALVLASFGLFPGQSAAAFGWEALAIGAVIALTGLVEARALGAKRRPTDPLVWTIFPLVLVAISALPPIIGGILLLVGNESGAYWIAVGIIMAFVTTLLSGWVLLVEILR
jgi:modulator of FtsH protease